ncbi:MAG: DUF4253 domain-containing protein [Candidatus Sumerlaeaceae bacterium]|nr:DUF4253 domain-containing protein [Candidatus Sumerlaeaceae bacterium]
MAGDTDFQQLRDAHTSAGNYDMGTDQIIDRLKQWQGLCSFRVTGAKHDRVSLEFDTLPADMGAFARDVYAFSPDIVDQGTASLREMVEAGELPEKFQALVAGVDFNDDNYGVEILKRQIQAGKSLSLWWD